MNTGRLCLATTLVMITMASSVVLIARDSLVVRMKDKCDPTTFNAAAGPGTCVGDGNITFAQFIKELTSAKKVGVWHFDPAAGTVDEGTVLALENRGGETHTFTKVENFGGGFVAPLNA
jgi:hypothetical protein